MKKLLIIFGILTLGASFTFGQRFVESYYNHPQYINQDFANQYNGNVEGYGYGHRYWRGNDCNKMHPHFKKNRFARQRMIHQRFANRGQFKKITESDARLAVENAIKSYFPGAKITSVEKFIIPRGIIYSVDAIGVGGKKLRFRVNPLGKVIGPFVIVK